MENPVNLALVITRPSPRINVDHELPLLRTEIERADPSSSCEVVEWDDPDVDWAAFDLAVIRSTWDYTWRVEEYFAWIDRCAALTEFGNPVSVMRWSSNKRYLADLAAARVPVVPTSFIAPADRIEFPYDKEFVVKPSVGAGARYAARYQPADVETAIAQVQRMHREGITAMVQPYMTNIDTSGERALVFLGGQFLHAVGKNAVLAPGVSFEERKVAHPGLRAVTPTPAELDVAHKALAAVPGGSELLYARVDIVTGPDGEPVVIELELIEPNLFLHIRPESLPRAAKVLVDRAHIAAARNQVATAGD